MWEKGERGVTFFANASRFFAAFFEAQSETGVKGGNHIMDIVFIGEKEGDRGGTSEKR